MRKHLFLFASFISFSSLATIAMEKEPSITTVSDMALSSQRLSEQLIEFERLRDKVDYRDYPQFKETTKELCLLIGNNAVPEGEALHHWIDSIIRTRHKFSGQPCIGEYGLINKYVQNIGNLGNSEYLNHVALIMTIDAITKMAVADKEFAVEWKEQARNSSLSENFINKVVESLNTDISGWQNEATQALVSAVRNTLLNRPDLVNLSADIFSLYAPKLTVEEVYGELVVSGGNYYGWSPALGAFSHAINLTEKENEDNPGLESMIRDAFNSSVMECVDPVYPVYYKAILSEGAESEARIKYVYDYGLKERGLEVVGAGSFFYLMCAVKPEFKHLLKREAELTSEFLDLNEEGLYSLYRSSVGDFSEENFERWYQQGNVTQVYLYASKKLDEKINLSEGSYTHEDLKQGIRFLREAVDLGNANARIQLPQVLRLYARKLVKEKNYLEAIKVMKELLALGLQGMRDELSSSLVDYAAEFLQSRNLSEALNLLEESALLGNSQAQQYVSFLRNKLAKK